MSRVEGLDPAYWVTVRTPATDRRLSPLDVHQSDRRPPRKSPDGPHRVEYRSTAAKERRALRRAFRQLAHSGSAVAALGFRGFFREFRDANQLTGGAA